MGFDLYGMNPVMREINKDKYPTYNKYEGMDYAKRQEIFDNAKKDLQKEYYNEMTLRDKENPGIYFRSNVWWWRRLWAYAYEVCSDLTEEDFEGGSYNDCYKISEEKASSMAKDLQVSIDDGRAAHYENEIKLAMEQAEKNDDGTVKDWDMMYPFTVGHLQEFILFCSESGGFEIG